MSYFKKKPKIKVALVGCGAIGGALARTIARKPLNGRFQIVGLCDLILQRAQNLSRSLERTVQNPVVTSDYHDALLHRADLVIEAASGRVAGPLAMAVLGAGKDVLILSAGGLLKYQEKITRLAHARRAHLYIPSGALAGLDAVRAMGSNGLRRVTLVTRKPTAGFKGHPRLKKQKTVQARGQVCLFSGSVEEAVRHFPQNINVAALLKLGVAKKVKVRVKIFASPTLKANTHEVFLEGSSGKVRLCLENTPSVHNPKTSQLAILSVIATLNRISGYVGVGS